MVRKAKERSPQRARCRHRQASKLQAHFIPPPRAGPRLTPSACSGSASSAWRRNLRKEGVRSAREKRVSAAQNKSETPRCTHGRDCDSSNSPPTKRRAPPAAREAEIACFATRDIILFEKGGEDWVLVGLLVIIFASAKKKCTVLQAKRGGVALPEGSTPLYSRLSTPSQESRWKRPSRPSRKTLV